jgi:hypothetical protein
VAYDPLPAIVDVWQSLSGDVLLFEEHGTNLAYEFASALGDVDEAFRQADYTRKETFRCHRHTANPLETRGLVASYAPGRQELTVWGETKVPHFNRGVLAAMLQMPEHRIHFIEPDVGGGFGVRGEFYPENFLIPFAAKSGHMRFVHSRCQLGLCHGGYALDSRCDFRGIIELGEFVLPWAICLHVLLDVLHQIAEPFPFMVPCALVVHIAERPLNRIGTRTVRRQPEHLKARMAG